MKGQRVFCKLALVVVLIDPRAYGQSTLSPPYTCTTTVCRPGRGIAEPFSTDRPITTQGLPGKRGPVGPRGEKGDPCQCDVADEEAMDNLRTQWNNIKAVYEELGRRLDDVEGSQGLLAENCTAWKSQASDRLLSFDVVPIYPLKFIGDLTPRMTNCTKVLAEDEDGWVAIQRRMNGGTDFYLNWESYAKGFGDTDEEFWIGRFIIIKTKLDTYLVLLAVVSGLRTLHLMTSTKSCKLRIDFKDWDKSTRFAEYRNFRVGDEDASFVLTISGYTGNIQDSMAHHNGRRFSTFDRENDDHETVHCAERYKGAWWHGSCYNSNLNGIYFKTAKRDNTGVWWDGFSNSLPFVEMKVFCS